jgi:uncharacterized protein (TIGR01777 family)
VEPLTEKAGSGTGLLAAVARGWEAAALPAASATRLVRVRTGVVLAAQGGLLPPLITMAKAGLGGRFGTGRQYWPWISLQDEVRAWGFALERESLSGPVNLVGPSLASAGQITRSVAGQLGRPHWLALPSSPLRAVPGGSASELILASQPIRPAVLQAHGFQFLDQTVDQAIRAALNP